MAMDPRRCECVSRDDRYALHPLSSVLQREFFPFFQPGCLGNAIPVQFQRLTRTRTRTNALTHASLLPPFLRRPSLISERLLVVALHSKPVLRSCPHSTHF